MDAGRDIRSGIGQELSHDAALKVGRCCCFFEIVAAAAAVSGIFADTAVYQGDHRMGDRHNTFAGDAPSRTEGIDRHIKPGAVYSCEEDDQKERDIPYTVKMSCHVLS